MSVSGGDASLLGLANDNYSVGYSIAVSVGWVLRSLRLDSMSGKQDWGIWISAGVLELLELQEFM